MNNATDNTAIRSFEISVPRGDLDDLRDRLARTRWPSEVSGTGWSRGVPVDYLRDLVEYWRTSYDWRNWEKRLNAFPQFTTEIEGQTVHFLHVRSPEPGAKPLILTHGWPGSVLEFIDLIGPLTNPAEHGGDAADAFHVVVPSVPGYGFSGPTSEAGWTMRRVATAFAELMRRLGYDRYFAQGGDIGAAITRELGIVDREHVVAVHVNGGFSFPTPDEEDLATLTESEKARVERMNEFMQDAGGYLYIQSTRPQTLAYGLHDSPVGQLAWIIDKVRDFTNLEIEIPTDAIDRDKLLTNVTLYWLTGTSGSSAAVGYYEDAHSGAGWGPQEDSGVPAGVAQFTIQDVSIRRYDEQHNNIVHWTEYDRGGHFAALEAPDLFLGDVRSFFRGFR